MPSSSGKGRPFIGRHLKEIRPQKILDVGCGKGNLPKRYRKSGQTWTGIEIFKPYIKEYKLHQRYEQVRCEDARVADFGTDTFDLVFLGDVLEHMTYEEAQDVLRRALIAAPVAIVSIPVGYYPQGTVNGNMHERHITNYWDAKKVREKFGEYTDFAITPPIGTFIFRRASCASSPA